MEEYHHARQRAFVLGAAHAILGAATAITMSLGGLAGGYLLDQDKSLATLPISTLLLGMTLGAWPAALLMQRTGRRSGFVIGAAFTGGGGLIAALALLNQSFWLFALGTWCIGVGGSFVHQYRFAATDGVHDKLKSKLISFVMIGGVASAIIGPQIAIYTRDLFEPILFAGAFFAVGALAAIGMAILTFLPADQGMEPSVDLQSESGGRALTEILRQPAFIAAFACAVCAFATMSFLMTGAPLAMVGCGYTVDQSTLGIQWHVIAMFAPSFFTGHLIARFGCGSIAALGMLLLVFCAAIGLSGVELWQFWTGLILLGVGWNFAYIGATAMVTATCLPNEKNKVQGVHDFALFSIVAFASLMSGRLYDAFGWYALNMIVIPVCTLCFVYLLKLSARSLSAKPAG